jgi:hypothetical protein
MRLPLSALANEFGSRGFAARIARGSSMRDK